MSVFIVTGIFLTLVGLTFGSFVNAAVWRIHQGRARSLLNDRSECPHCGHKLAWFDLIPVLSWLSLGGKCRYCGAPIDDTPLSEVGVALYFLISYLAWPGGLTTSAAIIDFVFWLLYSVPLAILVLYDRRYMLLPNKLTYPLIALAAIHCVYRATIAGSGAFDVLGDAVLGVASVAGIYLVLYNLSRGRWVGFGDIKLGVFIGVALISWQLGLVTFLLANLIGCLVILPGLLTRRLSRASRIPFGPFLIAGFFVAGLFGQRLFDLYTTALGL